jgi:integrase
MQDQVNTARRVPWNKGKLTGAKPPLRPKHVWSIRTKLQIEGRTRDLAMFNLAIDSKLRGCDVVAIRVEDVAAGGYTADRATVRQKKTGRPVRFELSEQTRQAVDDYLRVTGKRPGEFLFTGRPGPDRSMTTRQYARPRSMACTQRIGRIAAQGGRRRERAGLYGVLTQLRWVKCFQRTPWPRRAARLRNEKYGIRINRSNMHTAIASGTVPPAISPNTSRAARP